MEQAKIDVLGYQAENKNGILEEAQLKAVLEKYFINSEIPENFPSDLSTLELTTQNKYGTYKINVSEIYNGSFGTTSDLSIDDIMSLGEYIGFFNEDEFMGKYENNYYRVNIRNNSVTKIEMKKYFLIEEIVNESVDACSN